MNEFKQKERYSIEYLKDRFLRVGCGPV